jgi:hypothetical protein
MRECASCKHVFDLFKDGFVEGKPQSKPPAPKSGQIAQSRTPGPERELKRNPFELRDLAMITRT